MPPSRGHLINMDSMPNTSIESFVVLESFAVLEGGRLGSGFESRRSQLHCSSMSDLKRVGHSRDPTVKIQ